MVRDDDEEPPLFVCECVCARVCVMYGEVLR